MVKLLENCSDNSNSSRSYSEWTRLFVRHVFWYPQYVWYLFIHWVYYYFTFLEKFQKLDSDLSECFEKLEVILESLKCQEETKKKSL